MHKKLAPGAFFGTTVRRFDLGGLILAETVFPSGLAIPPHEHTNAFLALMLEGACTQTCARRTWNGKPASLTVYPAELTHANHWHELGGRVLHVEFDRPWLERLSGRTTVLDRPADYEGGPQVWLAKRLSHEWRQQDDVSPLAIEGLVLELLAECSRSRTAAVDSRPPRWLNRVRELLRDRFSENLSLGEVAKSVRISADHITRSFRLHYACTMGEYVRKIRVEFACSQLALSDAPLAQIALDAGFTDQSHFTKTFKRHMGLTPSAFRNLHHPRMSRTNE